MRSPDFLPYRNDRMVTGASGGLGRSSPVACCAGRAPRSSARRPKPNPREELGGDHLTLVFNLEPRGSDHLARAVEAGKLDTSQTRPGSPRYLAIGNEDEEFSEVLKGNLEAAFRLMRGQ